MAEQSRTPDTSIADQYPARVEKALDASVEPWSGSIEESTQKKTTRSRIVVVLLFVWSQWFTIMCGLVIVVAYLVPDVAKRGGHLQTQYTFSYGALALIFLIAGLTIPTKLLWTSLGQWKMHIATQGMCFVVTPLVGLAIVEIVIATGNHGIPQLILAGIVIAVCTPTTVASNVTFTRLCGGDEAGALIEVTIGNLLGIFVSAALVQLLVRPSLGLGIGAPTRGIGPIYEELIKHFGLALYLPLFVGQVVRNIWTDKVIKISKLLYLPKWSAICLLVMIWQTFSDAFGSGAFEVIPTRAIIMLVFLNIGLYPFFTLLSFYLARPPDFITTKRYLTDGQTVAVCFCGPQKSIAVGLVLIYIQYSNFTVSEQAIIAIPLALYQGTQTVLSQGFVIVFKRWMVKQAKLHESTATEEQGSEQDSV